MTFHWRPSRARPAAGRPLFDDAVMLLEERIMLDAVPVVSVSTPDNVLLSNPANNFQVTLTFDNAGSDPGFGPYVEINVPKNGADGGGFGTTGDDGATFVRATYLGQPVTVAANLTFDAAGHATNPLTGDIVSGAPGDGLVVLRLPFGSFTGPQTPAALIATFAQSPLGDIGVPLTIAARGGFQYGGDALDNPLTDPRIVGATASASYTPTLAILTKTSDAPANTSEETATGPNNDHFYTINLDVANGQKLTAATLRDALPDSIVYLGATVVSGGGTITDQPAIGSVVNPADNALTVSFASLTGGPGTADAVVRVHFYVNDTRFDGTPVVDPTTGATATTVNTAHLDSTFTPLDPLDPIAVFSLDATQVDTIRDRPVAIQKSATIVGNTGPAGLNSGDTIEYRLTIQVSDYFSLGDLSLNDVLTDGQRLDTSFLPTIAVKQRGVTTAVAPLAGVAVNPLASPGDTTTGQDFTGTFASLFNAVTGTTTSTINISAALILGGIDGDGVLAGGRTQPGDAAASTGGTTVTVTFRALVQNNFDNDAVPPANRAVHQGDTVGNGVTIAASVRANAMPLVVLDPAATRDDGVANLTVARGGVGKAIYAINGDTNLANFTVGGTIQLVASDRITYRLTYDLPITSYQALTLTDFLPLPVLTAQSLAFSATPLVAGTYGYGPTDTLHLQPGAPTPTETFDVAGNSVRFAFSDYAIQNAGTTNQASKIDLLFTLAVQDTNFADGLFLTNLATSSESNTPGNATSGNSIVRFALGQPKLLVQKAIVSATAGTITTPETVAALTFLAPGVTSGGRGYVQTAPLTDALIGGTAKAAAANLNSNVTGLDAGDDARVAIVINNQGSSASGAFNTVLNDVLAPGTSFRGGSLATANLIVTRGDGLIFTAGTDYTATQTPGGVTIQFLDGATGRIERNGATNRGDIVLVTYDIHLDNTVTLAPVALTSSATVSKYTAVPGGLNQALVPPTDPATIGLRPPAVAKVLLSTTDASTTGSNITIGENAVYQVTYTLAEGTSTLVRLVDQLPRSVANGFYQFVSASIVSVGANLKQADGTTAADAAYFGAPTFGIFTNLAVATFGGAGRTIVNLADNVLTADDTIVVNYVVRATTAPTNVTGITGVNTGQISYGAANTKISATAPIGLSLPDLTVVKAFVPGGNATPDANDPVTFTITVANPGTVTGYGLKLSDPFPAGLSALTVTGVTGAGLTPADFSTAANALTLLTNINLAGGQSFTVTVSAILGGNTHPGSTLTNTASLGFDTEGGVPPGVARTITKTGSAQIPIAPDTIVKTLFTTSVGNDANPAVTIGELVTFDLTTLLVEGQSDALTINDALPAGLVFVSGQIVSVGANITGATLNPALTTPGGVPTFVFGNVADLADNLPQNTADQIVVRITARVANVPGNISGTVLTDVASASTFVDGATKALTSALPVTVAVPDLIVTKALTSGALPDAGDTASFAITVRHAAGSTATAFDLGLLDTLPAGLTNLQVTAVNNDPEGDGANGLALTTASFTTAGNSLALATPIALALGQSFTVTIAATVTDATVVGSTVTNAASATFSTLPGASPNERSFTRGGSAGFTTNAAQTLTKAIVSTDDPLTGTAQFRAGIDDVAIGESASVLVTASFVQGTTPGVVLVDRLPVNAGPPGTAATFGFVGAPVLTAAAGVTFTGSGVGVLSDANGDGILDTVTYSLGSVTVAGTPSAGTGAVTIAYTTTPLDRPENAAGDALASAATLTSALGSITRSVDYDLVAPLVTITKTAVTNFGASAEFVDYTITVTNTGTGPAGNLSVNDVLPAGVVQLGPPLTSLDGGPNTPGAFNLLPALAAGSSLKISFLAGVTPAAVGGATLTNVATVTFDSHEGPGGRPGSATATANFVAPGTQTLVKTITATGDPLTGSAQFRSGIVDLGIGETADVRVVATLHQGTTTNVVLSDRLPINAGSAATGGTFAFDFTPFLSLPAGTTITGSTTPLLSDSDGDGIADTVTYTLGNVTIANPGSVPGVIGDATADIAVIYTTRVLDRPENTAGDALNSPAALTSGLGTKLASVDYDLVTPTLVITKAVATTGLPDAGDSVDYTVTVTNTGSGPAEAVRFTDAGAAGVRLGGALVTTGATSFAVTLPGTIDLPSLLPGASATIVYAGVVRDSAVVGAPEVNTASVAYVSGVQGGGRPGSASASASFTTAAAQAFTKIITATDDPFTGSAQFRPGVTDLAIDERATVTLTATFVQGTTPNVVIVDRLPVNAGPAGSAATFAYNGFPTLTVSSGVTFTGSATGVFGDSDGDGIADTVTYTLGSVTVPGTTGAGTGTVTVTYQTSAVDRPENQAGDAIASPASLNSALGMIAASVDYDIVAPNLVVTKTIDGPTTSLDAGDFVFYTMRLTNTGTGPASDLGFIDVLPPGLRALGAPSFSINGGNARYDFPVPTLLPGSYAEITVLTQITNAALAGTPITNTVTIPYDSHAGPGGRAAIGVGSVTFTTLASQALTKTITSTSDPLTGAAQFRAGVTDLAIGENAVVQLVATLQQGTTTGVVITDRLPTNTGPAGTAATFAFGSFPFLQLPFGATITGSVLPLLNDTDGDGVFDTVTFNLGNVTIAGTQGPGTGDIRISYNTQALDRPENQAGDALTSPATLASSLGTIVRSVDYDLVAPLLTATKTVTTTGTPDAGDSVGYIVTLTNTGSGPAENIVVTDLGPAGVRFQLATVTVGGTNTTQFIGGGSVAVPALVPGGVATIAYTGVVQNSAIAGSTQTNTATASYSSSAFGGRPASVGASASFVTSAAQSLTKTITATDDPLTGSAQFRPGITDLAIGEQATVALTATLVQGTTPGVVIVDRLPINAVPGATGATFGFVGAPVLTRTPGVTFTGSGVGVLSDSDGDGVLDTVTYSLGSFTVPGSPGAGTGGVTITYRTTPLDRPENAAGDALASGATLTSAIGTLARSVDYDLVAPVITVTKEVATIGTPDAGDAVGYTVTIANSGSGPAGDLTLSDLAAAGITSTGSATLTVGGVSTVFASPNAVTIAALDAGQTATVTYAAVVGNGAVAGSAQTNTASVAFDSHAGFGGRPGSASGSATFTTNAAQTLTKVIAATDDPLTGMAAFRPVITDLAIGESANVLVTASFVQGTTPGVVLIDRLPVNAGPPGTAATFGFVAAPVLTAAAGVTFTGSSVGVLSDANGDGILDTVTYSLGSVTVAGTPGAGTGAVTIAYTTTPLDRPENAAGDALASAATLTSALGSITRSVDYDLVAPLVTVTKAVATIGTPDAGDTVGYAVTIANTGSGPAADLALSDVATPGIVAGGATVTVGGTTTTFASPGAVRIATLAAGQSAIVTYAATVGDGVATGTAQTNTATVAFDSHFGPGGRPGSASGSAAFTTAGSLGFTKTIVATSVAATGTAQFRPGVTDLVIGETATFELVATLSEGTTTGVVITDRLPAAMIGDVSLAGTLTFTGQATVSIGGVTVALTADQIVRTDTNGDGRADTITFNLGTVVIPGSNDPGRDTIRIRYDVVAANLAVNASGDLLTSPATLVSSLGSRAASVDVDLVQPVLTITTTANVAAAVPGDIVTYTVVVANPAGGTAQAEDVTIRDLLDGDVPLTLIPGTVTTSQGSVRLGNDPADTSVNIGAGAIAVGGAPVVVTFQARIGAALPGTVVNTIADTLFDGIPGAFVNGQSGRRDSVAEDAPVGIVGFAKAIIATSLPETGSAAFRPAAPDLAIGELATFTLTVALPAGTTPVSLTDLLGTAAGQLELVGTPMLTTSAGVVAGPLTTTRPDLNGDGVADLGFALGLVSAPAGGATLTITYVARVADIARNASGSLLDLPATLNYGPGTISDARSVDLVAPNVTLAKTVAVGGTPQAGGTASYTVTAANVGTGPAYDLILTDILPAGLRFVPGSATLTIGGAISAVDPAAVSFRLLDAGQSAVLRFDAAIGDGAVPGATLINTASVAFDSLAGPGGRTGSAGASASFATATGQALVKTITATDDLLTGAAQFRPGVTDLAVGETATVALTAWFAQGTTPGVVIVDRLPTSATGATFGFVTAPVLTPTPGVTFTGSGVGVLSDSDGDGIADTVTYTLGSVTVAGAAGAGTGSVTLTYGTTPLDRPENAAGAALASPATLSSAVGTIGASVGYDLVAPAIVVTKAVVAGTPDAGDTVTYTVTLTNTGSGPAGDIALIDLPPTGVRVVGPATLSVGGVTTVFASPDAVRLAVLDAGQSAVVTYAAIVADSAPTGAPATNTATVTFDSHAGPGGRPGSASGSATFTTAAGQQLTKTIVATSEAFTGSGQFRAGVPDLTIGEVATIELRATLSEGVTTGVVFTDTLAVAGGTLILTGQPVIVLADGRTVPFTGTIVQTDTNDDGVPDTVRFVVGTVALPGDNDPTNNFFTIRYQAVVADRAENVAGDQLTLPATLTSSAGSATAAAGIDLVAPSLTVTKLLAASQPTDGSTTVFVITISHAATSSAAATNVVLTDLVPAGTLISGNAVIVSGPAGATVRGGTVTVPLLPIGETLVARIATQPELAHPAFAPSFNQASVTFASTSSGGGRMAAAAASAPIPASAIVSTIRLPHEIFRTPVERRYVSPLLPIEPVYSGAAEPGSYVQIVVTDELGSISSEGGALTDADGNWLIRQPTTTADTLLRNGSLDDYYESTRLFSAPGGTLFAGRDLFGAARPNGRIDVGAVPAFGTQVVHVNVTDSVAGFTAVYAPTWRDQVFVDAPGLSVERAFASAAGRSIERLYDELAAPEAAGLNRFNHAFLSAAEL